MTMIDAQFLTIHGKHVCIYRGGGTGPASPAMAGPTFAAPMSVFFLAILTRVHAGWDLFLSVDITIIIMYQCTCHVPGYPGRYICT